LSIKKKTTTINRQPSTNYYQPTTKIKMLIKNIEHRIKINKIVSISTIAFAVFIVIAGFFFAYRMIEDSRKSIYILDNGVPVLAKQTDVLLNRLMII
jgi:uncharacterized membrane protein YvbJ